LNGVNGVNGVIGVNEFREVVQGAHAPGRG